MAKHKKSAKVTAPKDRLLPRLTTFFFDRPRLAALLWASLVIFGGLSYTTLLKREGFPSVNIPLSVVGGAYYANDPTKVDSDVAKPLSDIALKEPGVKSVQSQSAGNFFSLQITYDEGVDAKKAVDQLEQKVKAAKSLPQDAIIQYNVPYFGVTGGDIQPIDVAASFYNDDPQFPLNSLTAKAEQAVAALNAKKIPGVKSVFLKNPYEKVTDPMSGQAVTVQKTFDRFAHAHEGGSKEYSRSVIIGLERTPGYDVIKLDTEVRKALDELENDKNFGGFSAEVSASYAPQIKENIGELQRVLLEGLIAVLVVGSIVIAIRASFITVISMVTVLLATLGFLFLIGYTLNVITLFALILGLSLIVDDTIIMVEAIDAARHKTKDRRKAIQEATRKISRAMVAATATASLSFAPLLFVGGILGAFIRAIPITIISSLVISLFVALIFIPFMARYILLGKKQMGKTGVTEIAAGFENKLAAFIAGPMLWARNSKKRLFGVGTVALVIGFGFIFAGLNISKNVVFNIFPPTKDTNGLVVITNFKPGTPIEQAESVQTEVEAIATEVLGANFVQSSLYATGSAQSSTQSIELTSYNDRDVTSTELVKQLQDTLNKKITDAQTVVGQADVGPPSAAFVVQVDATDREAALKVAGDIATYLQTAKLERVSGKDARFTNPAVSSSTEYLRSKGKPIVTVSAGFDGNDTTTLVTLAQDAVKKEFSDSKLSASGLNASDISFDLGQESENQDSFKTLALAFPILLMVMFVLLAIEFRSLLQPLLIFMAIPFSIFGVMLGLYLTDNAISFFTMLGFFALIGLSIKNTILLTDYANQARRSGHSAIDAAVAALEERFRPLFATSVTAVVSLIPLAISSPFWQGLSVVLIFGLLSSTFLVVTVFPYYYLGAEFLRARFTARNFILWATATLIAAQIVGAIFGAIMGKASIGWLVILASILWVIYQRVNKAKVTPVTKKRLAKK